MPLFVISFAFGQTLELSIFADFCLFGLNLPFSYNRHLSRFPSLSPHLSFWQTFDGFLPNPPFSQFDKIWWNRQLSILLVCTWRHGGHVGGLEQKHFSPPGTNSIFMLILWEKLYCIDSQHGRLVSWLQTNNASVVVSFKILARPLINPNSPISQNLSFS